LLYIIAMGISVVIMPINLAPSSLKVEIGSSTSYDIRRVVFSDVASCKLAKRYN